MSIAGMAVIMRQQDRVMRVPEMLMTKPVVTVRAVSAAAIIPKR